MRRELVIIGAGGFGREVLDVIERVNDDLAMLEDRDRTWHVLGFLDDGDPDVATLEPYGVAHLGGVDLLADMDPGVQYVIGIGSPQVRRAIDERFRDDRKSPTLIHPSVTRGRAVSIGAGSVVCAGVRLTNNIQIGRHVHLNLNSTVGHDAHLSDYVTVSPLVAISGHVRLGDEVLVGTGASLNPGRAVGAGSVIGAGASVVKDVPAGVVAVGVPAKPR